MRGFFRFSLGILLLYIFFCGLSVWFHYNQTGSLNSTPRHGIEWRNK